MVSYGISSDGDGFPRVIAPAFSTPAFSAPPLREEHSVDGVEYMYRRFPTVACRYSSHALID